MKCPKCNSEQLHVVDRRIRNGLIVRRRQCLDCLHRFNTVEITMDEYDNVLAVMEQKRQLVEHAQVFSEIVQGIVDTIPDRKFLKRL